MFVFPVQPTQSGCLCEHVRSQGTPCTCTRSLRRQEAAPSCAETQSSGFLSIGVQRVDNCEKTSTGTKLRGTLGLVSGCELQSNVGRCFAA